jgi:hypothetical protein
MSKTSVTTTQVETTGTGAPPVSPAPHIDPNADEVPAGTEVTPETKPITVVPEEETPVVEPHVQEPTTPPTTAPNIAPAPIADVIAAHEASKPPDVTPSNELLAQEPNVPLV